MSEQKIEFYKGPAGGWGALKSVSKALLAQDIPLKGAKTLLSANQPDGFDCPGCAWPDRNHASTFEFCENGVKAVAAEATARRVTREFFAQHTVTALADQSDFYLEDQGRLTEPMVYDAGTDKYLPIAWDDAFALVARHLDALPDPNQAMFYTSGRTSNEAAFLYQLFVREYGTNNFPDCSNMCHEPSGSALRPQIGVGKGTVTLEDFEKADAIFIFGQNPGTNHPRMLSTLEEAKGNGATIVAVNPLPEAGLMRFKNPQNVRGVVGKGTPLADEFCQIRLGGDLAFFRALGHLVLAAEDAAPGTVLDREFIESCTHGFEEWAADIRQLDWDEVDAATGLSREQIAHVARLLVESKRTIICWAMGLTQHKQSVPTIRELVNVLLLRGMIGKPGAGVCPVRGHSNVQGDRTMGIYEKPAEKFLSALDTEFGITSPRAHGYDTVEAIHAMRDGKAKVFFAVGGNFVSATPDTEVTMRALRSMDLTAHVSTKLNMSHVVPGRMALILPTLGRTERDEQAGRTQFVTVEDSMSCVHRSRGRLAPASGELLSEVAIVSRLARAVFGDDHIVPWASFEADYDLVRDRISRVVPGCSDYNARVREPDGFILPHPPRDSRSFPTTTGKANFTVNPVRLIRVPEGRLILQTLRSHDQYNTTIYGLDDRYRGVHDGRRVVFVNPDDLSCLGITDGSMVDMISEWPSGDGVVERRVKLFRVIAYPTAPGCAAAYFPEANALVPLESTAETSNTPTSKAIIIRLERS